MIPTTHQHGDFVVAADKRRKLALSRAAAAASGPAVVDAAGEIYGDVVNVAARVQALAEPGAVLDMPWNPMRVEQRIGRIDRLGQEEPLVCLRLAETKEDEARAGNKDRSRTNIYWKSAGFTNARAVPLASIQIVAPAPSRASTLRLASAPFFGSALSFSQGAIVGNAPSQH
jgi:hypothetical protein